MKEAMVATERPTTLVGLRNWLLGLNVIPIDSLHVAALLEMDGWTDRRAVGLGYEDLFDLGQALFGEVRSSVQVEAPPDRERKSFLSRLYQGLAIYLRGLVFAMPMVVSSLSVLTLRYSLWSYMDFSTEIATAIALGTFLSFLVAGGFTQAIARRGLFYLSQDQFALVRRSSIQLMGVAVLFAVGVGAVAGLFLWLVPVLPWSIVKVAGLYYSMLTLLWLGAALLYMMQRELVLLGLIAGGILMVYVEVEIYRLPVMFAQVVAMAVVVTLALTIGFAALWWLERTKEKSRYQFTARWSQISRTLAPYFLYGMLYFGLLFSDRLMAWSVPGEFHPYLIWFLGDYELGLDWALWTLVLPIGLAEVYIHAVFRRIHQRQQVTTQAGLERFNRRFRREHVLQAGLVVVGGLASLVLVRAGMEALVQAGLLPFDPLGDPRTRLVFYLAAPSYSIVAVGLLNALVLFSLSEPWPAVRACAWSLAGNLVVGFLASRYGGHEWAVLGLVTGALLFAGLTGRTIWDVLGRLDYYLMRTV